jgi:hypothetical protein
MSLINDALRRTEQARRQAPPSVAPGPQLYPLKAAPFPAPGRGLMRLGVAGAAGLAALFLIWQGSRSQGRAPVAASAPAARQSSPEQPASPASTGHDTPGQIAPAAGQPAVGGAQSERAPGKGAELAANAPSTSIPVIPGPGPGTNPLAGAPSETSLPGPPVIRLQAIVFHPTRPSAMINGKTLFVGDMLGEMQLVAIGRESATLVGAGQTNLLTLR